MKIACDTLYHLTVDILCFYQTFSSLSCLYLYEILIKIGIISADSCQAILQSVQ